MSILLTPSAAIQPAERFAWGELPPLPPASGQTMQAGVAGPFVGVHNDALLVAGGANFPGKPPWAGGTKAWWDDILVLTKQPNGTYEWVVDARNKLPRPMGYGMSFNTSEGVVCVGGADNDHCYAEVFILSWNPWARTITTTPLPPLPKPRGFMGGAMIGNTLYIAGGQSTIKDPQFEPSLWALDLTKQGQADFGWKELPAWPGPGRILPVAAAQSNGKTECFYLFSGRLPRAGAAAELLTDSYVYDPQTKRWSTLAKVGSGRAGVAEGVCVMAGTAAVEGDREILVLGGDGGNLFKELEAHDLKVAALRKELAAPGANQAALSQRIDAELQEKIKIYGTHPGFSAEILAYDTRTGAWRVAGQMSVTGPVTTLSTKWNNAWVIPSGEERPGIRTTRILRLEVKSRVDSTSASRP